MNRERLAVILKRCHPDLNGGSNSHIDVVRKAITLYQRDRKERVCPDCGEGKSRISKRCRMCNMKVRYAKPLMLAGAALYLCALNVFSAPITNAFYPPGTVTLLWDAPPPCNGCTTNLGYRLYAHTNAITKTNLASALVRLDAGTNRTAAVTDLAQGLWRFAATSYTTNGTESVPSDNVTAEVPAAPQNMRTVILQWNAEVANTNWFDAGYFRVKLGP